VFLETQKPLCRRVWSNWTGRRCFGPKSNMQETLIKSTLVQPVQLVQPKIEICIYARLAFLFFYPTSFTGLFDRPSLTRVKKIRSLPLIEKFSPPFGWTSWTRWTKARFIRVSWGYRGWTKNPRFSRFSGPWKTSDCPYARALIVHPIPSSPQWVRSRLGITSCDGKLGRWTAK